MTDQPPAKPDLWDRSADWLAEDGALPALALITMAMVFIYLGVFRDESAGDDLTFHMAESARLSDCIAYGDWDFWNPSANAGFASAYYYQVIPQLASAIPTALFGHHLFWFQLSIVLPLVLAPAAAYRGTRLLGATPWQAVIAAFAVAFTTGQSKWGGGADGTFQVGLYTQTWALAAFPLALGHAARWVTDERRLAPAIGWGTFVFLCHPFAGVSLALAVIAALLGQVVLRGLDRMFVRFARWLPETGLRGELRARWESPPQRPIVAPLVRATVLGVCLALTWMPIWLPLLIDYSGFGGFPHRVGDEIGPGFLGLLDWHVHGLIFDFNRAPILTWSLPVVLLTARTPWFRWLWTPALLFAVLLSIGPHVGTTQDDLFPAVRFLGAMQVVVAIGIGVGGLVIGQWLWQRAERSGFAYAIRTGLAAAAAALVVLVALPGGRMLQSRVRTLDSIPGSHRDEIMAITAKLTNRPGRKQAGAGAENHWWNLMPYVYGRVPALLQMGGGGLQSSPNYDFLWTSRDLAKDAWIFDAPMLVFQKSSASTMPVGDTIAMTENFEARRLPTPGLVSPVQITGVMPPGRKAGHAAALEWIKTDLPLKDHLLAYDGSGDAGPPPAGRTIRAWRQDSPGDDADIYAEVDATARTTFVIRESWHPRWHAYLDGVETTVRRVTPDFPAVDVPAGKHWIAMRFERPWWMHAAWLPWPLITLAAWLVTRRRRASATT